MVIAIDPGDIMIPYAKEMEKLCNIYDGNQFVAARGYHLCQVTAATLAHNGGNMKSCGVRSDSLSSYTKR